MPTKVETSPGFAMACLARAKPNWSFKSCIYITGNFKYCVSDNVLDQFIDVRIISIVQQYFKVTITKQFEP